MSYDQNMHNPRSWTIFPSETWSRSTTTTLSLISPCSAAEKQQLQKIDFSLTDDCLYKCQIQLFESLFKSEPKQQNLQHDSFHSECEIVMMACSGAACVRLSWCRRERTPIVLQIFDFLRIYSLRVKSCIAIITINSMSENEWTKCVRSVCWLKVERENSTSHSPHSRLAGCCSVCTFFEFRFSSRVVVYCITHLTSCK